MIAVRSRIKVENGGAIFIGKGLSVHGFEEDPAGIRGCHFGRERWNSGNESQTLTDRIFHILL
jgi:hypothetical protein